MNMREAKRQAWREAGRLIRERLLAGYPYVIIGDVDPDESEEDLQRMDLAMREVAEICEDKGRKRHKGWTLPAQEHETASTSKCPCVESPAECQKLESCPDQTETCDHCGAPVENRYRFECPRCCRPGCPECMPAGRNVVCPKCEDQQDEEL